MQSMAEGAEVEAEGGEVGEVDEAVAVEIAEQGFFRRRAGGGLRQDPSLNSEDVWVRGVVRILGDAMASFAPQVPVMM